MSASITTDSAIDLARQEIHDFAAQYPGDAPFHLYFGAAGTIQMDGTDLELG